MSSNSKNSQLAVAHKQIAELKKRVRELRCDATEKEQELQNVQRTLKYTKVKEFEVQLATF